MRGQVAADDGDAVGAGGSFTRPERFSSSVSFITHEAVGAGGGHDPLAHLLDRQVTPPTVTGQTQDAVGVIPGSCCAAVSKIDADAACAAAIKQHHGHRAVCRLHFGRDIVAAGLVLHRQLTGPRPRRALWCRSHCRPQCRSRPRSRPRPRRRPRCRLLSGPGTGPGTGPAAGPAAGPGCRPGCRPRTGREASVYEAGRVDVERRMSGRVLIHT